MTRRTNGAWLLCLLLSLSPALAWDAGGHYRVAEAAVLALPEEVPGFFRWGSETVAHVAIDPDVMKSPDTPQLRDHEYPEHFLDYELVEGAELPELRYDFVTKLIKSGQKPSRVGFVPYAVVEGTQRLSLAFAEYRCWPDNPHVHGKALVYAGLLAHYASDMIQPLHTSVHYDGRANAAGESPHSGIHRRMDSLFEQAGFASPAAPFEVQATAELWPAVVDEFMDSHALVDRVYALDPALEALYDGGAWAPELSDFAAGRYRHTVEFLAGLYLTAWRQSAAVELSPWLRRRGPEGELAPCDAP